MKTAQQFMEQIRADVANSSDNAYIALAEAVMFLLEEAPHVEDCRQEDWDQDGDS